MEGSPFDWIPDTVVLEHIMGLLIPSRQSSRRLFSNVGSLARTCRRMRRLATDPILWRMIDAAVFHGMWHLPAAAKHCLKYKNITAESPNPKHLWSIPTLESVSGSFGSDIGDERCALLACTISALRGLTELSIFGDHPAKHFAVVELPPKLRSLEISPVRGRDLSAMFTATRHAFYLRNFSVSGVTDGDLAWIGKLAGSCHNLEEVKIAWECSVRVSWSALSPLWIECKNLQKLNLTMRSSRLTGPSPPERGLQLRELIVHMPQGDCACSDFGRLFPNLTKLVVDVNTPMSFADVAAISAMKELDVVSLCGRGLPLLASTLVPLVTPSVAQMNVSTLLLHKFNGDLSEFFGSQWCSQLKELFLEACRIPRKSFDTLTMRNGCRLAKTLTKLFLMDITVTGEHNAEADSTTTTNGRFLGRFISQFGSLRYFYFMTNLASDDAEGLTAEIGKSTAKLQKIYFNLPYKGDPVPLLPLVHMLEDAAEVTIECPVDQQSVDAIAGRCHLLRHFSVFPAPGLVISLPKGLSAEVFTSH